MCGDQVFYSICDCPVIQLCLALFCPMDYSLSGSSVLGISQARILVFPSLRSEEQTCVRSLGLKDLLDKKMPTHSSIFAWRIPRTEELGRLQSMGL